jgi:release factor glutamine methyltransferase
MSITVQACLQRQSELPDSDSPRLDLELLLAHVLERDRTYLYTWPEKTLNEAQLAAFEGLLSQRQQGHPVAHLLGQREFWGLPLVVDDSTLIPRPDTETLVAAALALSLAEDAHVLDLGTGTGAIALALASEQPRWQITAADASPAAVALAERNRQALGFNNVQVQQSHWFAQLAASRVDLIVSNPPYIDAQDPHLTQGDVRFEPLSALVAAEHGLADIRHIIDAGRQYLRPGGWLLLEHGYTQAVEVCALLQQAGYQQVHTVKDFGHNDRVSGGQMP